MAATLKRKASQDLGSDPKRSKNDGDGNRVERLFNTFAEADWKAYAHFDEKRYTRNLVSYDKKYSLFVMCWGPGQKSPVHNHGNQNTKSWIRVLEGALRHTRINKKSSAEILIRKSNGVVCIDDNVGEHSTGNASENEPAISLHLYSPPYLLCAFQDCNGKTSHIPPVHCTPGVDTTRLAIQTSYRNNPCFVNFRQLVQLLRREVEKVPAGQFHRQEHIDHIGGLVGSLEFNPKEWMQYASFIDNRYTRNMIGYDENFTVLLLCWEKGQMSPIHDHAGSSCWVKVLEGEVTEIRYANEKGPDGALVRLQQSTFLPDAVAYINDTMGLHAMGNMRADTRAISLHIYSPPYHRCKVFREADGSTKEVNIKCANAVEHEFTEASTLPEGPPPQSLDALVNALRSAFKAKGTMGLDDAGKLLNSNLLNFKKCEWDTYIHFGEHRPTRNLLALDENFSLVLNCWNVGQQTPVHDHDGRDSWMKVLEGEVVLRKVQSLSATEAADVQSISVKDGVLAHHSDELGLHNVLNSSKEKTAITVHLYSPPYTGCCYREPDTGLTKNLPVVYCSALTAPDMPINVPLSTDTNTQSASLLRSAVTRGSELFTDFETYLTCLHHAFKTGPGKPSDICRIMESLKVDEKEWKQYACVDSIKHSINLIAYNDMFSLHLICWGAGQRSAAHDHASSATWFTVLGGEVEETQFVKTEEGAMEESQLSTFSIGPVMYRRKELVHQIVNRRPETAYSLHLSSPPFQGLSIHDKDTGKSAEGDQSAFFK